MTSAIVGDANSPDVPPSDRSRASWWPEALAIAIALIAGSLLPPAPLSPDVSWQLWIAHQMRHGARLYVDIIETNPPLWFWMAMPVDSLAEATGTSSGRWLITALALAAAASLAATGRLLAHIADAPRAALLGYAALVILWMPLADIGQREQLVLIASLPYAALAGRRSRGTAVPRAGAIGVGIGAGLGFALKHYFLLVPLLLELWLIAILGRRYRPWRLEIIAMAALGAAYAIAIGVVTPSYLSAIVPMLRLLYGATGIPQTLRPAQIAWILTAAALLCRPRLLRDGEAPFATATGVAAIGFALAWAIQHKGWGYHAIATTGCLSIALAALLAERWRDVPTAMRAIGPALLLLPIWIGLHDGPYVDPYPPYTAWATAGLSRGSSIAFVGSDPALAWPLTPDRGFRYPSRHYGFWMLRAIAQHEAGDHDQRVAAFGRKLAADTAQDYSCDQPDRIAFVRPTGNGPVEDNPLDTLAFFSRDAGFRDLLGHYRLWRRANNLDVYQRIAPFPRPPATTCRREAE